MKRLWFEILLILISLILGGLYIRALFLLDKDTIPEPIIIETVNTLPPAVRYIEVPYSEVIYITAERSPIITERIVEVIKQPRWFKSEEELKTWLARYPTWGGLDCDDLQETLMFDALKDGFIITPIPVLYGKVFDEPVLNVDISGVLDFGAWTWIGNDLFYVDLRLKLPHYQKIHTVWRD